MENQRNIDLRSNVAARDNDAAMKALINEMRASFAGSPKLVTALDASQRAFEVYRDRQVELVSAVSEEGTFVPALRDAAYADLTRQREEALDKFLKDNRPDFGQD
jgi:uncharacterized protein YecT (DUF1311 family)